jgi:glycosyltransferase involved in cell wall biosynthesis
LSTSITIVNKFYSPDIGGVETVVRDHAHELSLNYNVNILCVSKKFSFTTKFEIIDGIKIIRCSSFGTYFSMPISFSFFYHFWLTCKKGNALYLHYPYPLSDLAHFLFFKGGKSVVYWHSDIIKQKKLKQLITLLTNRMLKKSQIWTSSENLRVSSEFLSNYEEVKVLPLTVEDPVALSRDFVPVNFNNYFLFLGRLSYYKGIESVISALENENINQNVNVLIVGEGDLKNFIEERIAMGQIRCNVQFINSFISDAQKRFLLHECSAFLFPSTHSSEAFGLTQVEALAFNKPIINTFLSTGVPWVSLNGVTGFTINPGRVDELVNAINTLAEDFLKFGTNPRERYLDKFTSEYLKQRLALFFDKC